MTVDPNEERLSAWLDDELDDLARARLDRELAADPALRAQLATLRSLRAQLRRHGPLRAPEGFAHAIVDAVEADPATRTRAAWWRRPLGLPLEGLAVAAVTLVVLYLALPTTAPAPATQAPEGPVVGFTPQAGAPPGPTLTQVPAALHLTLPAAELARLPAALATVGGRLEDPSGAPLPTPVAGEQVLRIDAARVAAAQRALAALGAVEPVGPGRATRGEVTVPITVTTTP